MNAKLNLCHCKNSEVSFMGRFFVMYWAAIVDLCECQDELGDIAKITVSTVDFCGFFKVCSMAKKTFHTK